MVWIWTAKMKHHELVQQSESGKWNYELIMLWLKDDSVRYIDINGSNIVHLNILGNLGVLVFLEIKYSGSLGIIWKYTEQK